ncbi:autotransporter [Streptomyces sp. NBC_01465]|uniref:autotransporter n=1 Tax=Streptomyces sp. NBC_01465 TaxID=2903878 RepID=UPI002E336C68|nr:autotransporter [Streptomyces sp. NBC_01465]
MRHQRTIRYRSARHATLPAVLGLLVSLTPWHSAYAASGSGDITAEIVAGRDVTLTGDAVVRVPAGTTTYGGVIHGEGTLRIAGSGTLVLTKDSDFTLPKARQRQSVKTLGGNHPYVTVSNPDQPAVTVDRGATLQYGTGGGAGLIGRFPYNTPGFALNQDNIRVDGTLRLSLQRTFNLGTLSGAGLITQPRAMWGTLQLAGTHPFSGVIDNGTGAAAGAPEFPVALPNARAVLNQGTWTVDTPLNQTITLRQNFYQREYGSDINVQSRPGSKVILTGQYSYTDQGGDTHPTLSDPDINWHPVPKNVNKRGTNIKGANVQWGDGTTDKIFMPGTAQTVYINLLAARSRSTLAFAYNGPVTLGAPIGGGVFHDTLSAPGQGDIVIKGVHGNDVTFAAVQYYNGSTTIEKGATLRLGSGKASGDGALLTDAPLYQVVDNGALISRNTAKPLSLSKISGSGSFTQAGAATTSLTGALSYTGPTKVTKGTLALTGGSLKSSSAVSLTAAGTALDLAKAGDQTLRNVGLVKGATIRYGSKATLTLSGTSDADGLSGTFQGGELRSTGSTAGAFTVKGDYTQTREAGLTVRADGKPLHVTGKVTLAGQLRIDPKATPPTGGTETVILANSGTDKISGTFTGLEEGAKVTVHGTEYALTYKGGDGNDAALVATHSSGAPAAAAKGAPKAAGGSSGGSSFPWFATATAVTALAAAACALLFAGRRRRGRRRRGSHRAG